MATKSSTNNIVIVLAVIIVLILVYYLFSNHSSPVISTAGNSSQQSGSLGVTGPGVNGEGAGSTSGGKGNSYLSEQEASSLIGSGGQYNTSSTSNSTQISQLLTSYGPSSIASLANNISSMDVVAYTLNSSGTTDQLLEIVLNTSDPQAIYKTMLSYTNTTITVLNSTIGGMSYSYIQGDSPVEFSNLVGWKGNEVVIVISTGKTLNYTSLATTVSGDVP